MWTSNGRPGPYRLYRNESDDPYNIQTTWSADRSGYWSLRGYYNDSYHAACYVAYSGYADSAGSVAWGNVSSKPSNIMYYQSFTLDANTMDSNSTGFTYSVNAPYTGPIARFSTGGGYDLWLNAPYSGGGNALAFRTRNGDAGSYNAWKYVWHDGNMDAPNKSGTSYYQVQTWLQLTGYHGMYSTLNNAHFYPNPDSYGSWRSVGSRNGWAGIEFDSGVQLMMNYSTQGIHRSDTGWMMYIESRNLYMPGQIQAGWSDTRLKDNQKRITREDVFGALRPIRAHRFNWNEKAVELGYNVKAGDEEIGLIAQHVKASIPVAATVNKSGAKVDDDGSFDYLTICWDKITPYTVEAVNIHEEDIAELKAEVAELKAMIAKLIGETK